MQLIKGFFIAAVLCVASVSARNLQDQKEIESADQPVEKGFDVQEVTFKENDATEEEGEEKEEGSSPLPIIAAAVACACIGVVGAVYLKRRKDDDKLPGEIFTIDDKNSVL